jgi:hypothetical protein
VIVFCDMVTLKSVPGASTFTLLPPLVAWFWNRGGDMGIFTSPGLAGVGGAGDAGAPNALSAIFSSSSKKEEIMCSITSPQPSHQLRAILHGPEQ